MNFLITRIFREQNHYVDKLADLGLSLKSFTQWNYNLYSLKEDFLDID